MARRQVGIGALNRASTSQTQYAQIGTTLTAQTTADLTSQLSSFQSLLQTFATAHADEIRSNPQFRSEFARMCTSIGVDPLVGLNAGASAKKGKSWGWGLLGVGEFWVRVGTRVVGVCRRTRGGNGGFISVEEVRRILSEEDRRAKRPGQEIVEISEDDIVRSIGALSPLGPGLSIIALPNGERYIRSIPKELNPDQATVLEVAGISGGFISVSMLKVNMGWEDERGKSVLEDLVVEGMVWVDDGDYEREYWIPSGINEI